MRTLGEDRGRKTWIPDGCCRFTEAAPRPTRLIRACPSLATFDSFVRNCSYNQSFVLKHSWIILTVDTTDHNVFRKAQLRDAGRALYTIQHVINRKVDELRARSVVACKFESLSSVTVQEIAQRRSTQDTVALYGRSH